ncbi:ribosome recycling factor [Nocardioides sp. Kera G14]|uniref:ribosome recycling factor n=1 Tax=Nocardioides sp. Kera G14 TaxID=2884264 RepID=UPI001D11B27B|nr:ribosome recycling factor [Nocardioides sp. Kera G14]UDY25399.1 ribosome recycling factor [Nocardioides sp. Kera G14]
MNDILNEADDKMGKSVEATRENFNTIRAGRVTPDVFSKLTAEYYGTPTPLQQLATFTAPEPRVINIAPFDQSAMGAIEKAIRDSDLGVNPSNDGRILRAVFPDLTQERRKEFAKQAKEKAEQGRVSVRQVRQKAKQNLEALEKDGEVGKDEVAGAEKRLDALTKKHTDVIDELLKAKEAELLEV